MQRHVAGVIRRRKRINKRRPREIGKDGGILRLAKANGHTKSYRDARARGTSETRGTRGTSGTRGTLGTLGTFAS